MSPKPNTRETSFHVCGSQCEVTGAPSNPGTNYWLNWAFKASCWRDPLCVGVYLWVRGSVLATGVGLWTQGVCMSGYQQLRRLGSSGSYQVDCLLEHIVLYAFIRSSHCLSFHSAREGKRMKPSVACASMSSVFSVCVDPCGQPCVHVYICIGCMCVCMYWEYMLRLATGWTWGHRAHLPLRYRLAGCSDPIRGGGSAPHTTLRWECLRLSGINYEPDVVKHSGWLQE